MGSIVFGLELLGKDHVPDSTCVITKVIAYLPHRNDTETVCECVDKRGVKHSIVSNQVEFINNTYYLHKEITHGDIVAMAFIITIFLFIILRFFLNVI